MTKSVALSFPPPPTSRLWLLFCTEKNQGSFRTPDLILGLECEINKMTLGILSHLVTSESKKAIKKYYGHSKRT